jgi:hypothetical protein
MVEIPATPQPLGERIERLERENRNLMARLDKLEKRGGAGLFEVLRTALLLVLAAVVLHMMGFLGRGLERVPVSARQVDAEVIKTDRLELKELILQDRSQTGRAKLEVRDNEPSLTFLDANGRITSEVPPKTKP